MSKIGECPIVDWYKYKGQCKVRTCKFNTRATSRGCIAQDHRFPAGDKPITDAELLLYKFREEDINIRNVSARRKKLIQEARQYILLYYMIEYIILNKSPAEGYPYTEGASDIIDKVVKGNRLKRKRIPFEPWMLRFLIDPNLHKEFALEHAIDPNSVNIAHALHLKPKEYEVFCKAIQNLGKLKPLFA